MKNKEKEDVRRLRKERGLSVRAIAEIVGVAKSSVSLWIRDIELTDKQIEKLADNERKNHKHFARISKTMANTARVKRLKIQEIGRKRYLASSNLYKIGIALYWAEGSKSKNSVQLSNSDPDLLRLFKRFLDEEFDIDQAKYSFAVNVHLNNGKSLAQIEKFWADLFDLDIGAARKASVDRLPSSSKQLKKNKLIYGVCKLSVHSTEIAQTIFGSIKEMAGIKDQDLWLD